MHPPASSALVVGDPYDDVAESLAGSGTHVVRWFRRAARGRVATPWPAAGRFDLAALRLPRAKSEFEMSLHAVASRLAPEGRLFVYGANDEGIKSIARRFAPLFDRVETAGTGGHCRVLSARLVTPPEGLRPTLSHWQESFDPGLSELGSSWAGFPGVFSHGSLDPGTELLVSSLPSDLAGRRMLDYGVGTGLITGVCVARGAVVDALDIDSVAIEAARINVPTANVLLGRRLDDAPTERYDAIVSNPPIHRGKAETHDVLDALLLGAPYRLERRGTLTIVVQKRIAVEDKLAGHFAAVDRIAEDRVFKVVRARAR